MTAFKMRDELHLADDMMDAEMAANCIGATKQVLRAMPAMKHTAPAATIKAPAPGQG